MRLDKIRNRLKELVKKNGTYEFQANLAPQTCTEAQVTFYLLSFLTFFLVLLQIFGLICYFCHKRLHSVFCPNFLKDDSQAEDKEEEKNISE